MGSIFKMKHQKGEYGYLHEKKVRGWLHFIILVLIAVVIFVVGLALNKWEVANIFTVLAIVMVLPAAKALVAIVVTFPYKPMTEEKYQELKSLTVEGDLVYTDVVFTSSQYIMHLDFLVITDHQAIGLTTDKKMQERVDGYFRKELNSRDIKFVSFIADSEEGFKKRMKLRGNERSTGSKERDEVTEFIRIATV